MSEADKFLKYLLVVILVIIMCLYFNQQSGFKNKKNDNNNHVNVNTNNKLVNVESENDIEEELQLDKNIISNNNQICSNKRKCDLVEFTNGKYCLGPVNNFHQSFNPVNLRDLGWRNWWKKNVNKYNLSKTDNFQPIMKNFLKNQENTKNIYF